MLLNRIPVCLFAGIAILLGGCEPASTPKGSNQLASDQTFTYAVPNDIGVNGALDPEAVWGSDLISEIIAQNVFGGLYRYGEHQRLVPEIARELPEVSADGRQYTFHLRPEAKFWNGDPVRASDFVYSWNRAAADEPSNFVGPVPIAGFDEVARHSSPAMRGLGAPDDHTLIVTLTQPAGYWLSQLWMPSYWVVDEKAIVEFGVEKWWTTPEGLVGTGPFQMTMRTPGRVMEFEPVPNWWGPSTGHLKKVRVVVVADPKEAIREYDAGTVQSIWINPGGPNSDLSFYLNGRLSDLVVGDPFGTTWVAFNLNSGPFSGLEAGRDGRRAFSLSIDRVKLAKSLCAAQVCKPAMGGLLSPGLQGYLGDNEDQNARFDAARAQELYRHWDPDGSKVASLKYSFNFTPGNWRVAKALQQQWKANLGVDVKLDAVGDFGLFSKRRARGEYSMFRAFWVPDYDSPADWIDPRSENREVQMGGYANPDVDALAQAAGAKSPDIALPMYLQAERIMVEDVAYAALYYPRRAYLVKPFVQWQGSSAFIGHPWSEIKILSH